MQRWGGGGGVEGTEFTICFEQYDVVTPFGGEDNRVHRCLLRHGLTEWKNVPKSLQVFETFSTSDEVRQEDVVIDDKGNNTQSGFRSNFHINHG